MLAPSPALPLPGCRAYAGLDVAAAPLSCPSQCSRHRRRRHAAQGPSRRRLAAEAGAGRSLATAQAGLGVAAAGEGVEPAPLALVQAVLWPVVRCCRPLSRSSPACLRWAAASAAAGRPLLLTKQPSRSAAVAAER
jgi:hypothetical protein